MAQVIYMGIFKILNVTLTLYVTTITLRSTPSHVHSVTMHFQSLNVTLTLYVTTITLRSTPSHYVHSVTMHFHR